jgi:hypothetical protein
LPAFDGGCDTPPLAAPDELVEPDDEPDDEPVVPAELPDPDEAVRGIA